jgi:hypothetical protein
MTQALYAHMNKKKKRALKWAVSSKAGKINIYLEKTKNKIISGLRLLYKH